MKTSTLIFILAALAIGCSKSSDPAPSTTGNFGSWSYKGDTYKGTFSAWANFALQSIADKPHSSGLQAWFINTTPTDGNYDAVQLGSVSSNKQVAIAVVDSSLPAITYSSVENNQGTVSVSHSGSTITVTVTNLKLKGLYPSNGTVKADSIVVTGTIVK